MLGDQEDNEPFKLTFSTTMPSISLFSSQCSSRYCDVDKKWNTRNDRDLATEVRKNPDKTYFMNEWFASNDHKLTETRF